MKIPLIKPFITEEIKQKVIEVLDSGYLTEGPVTKEFEELFKEYIGCTHAIAVTSCTTGLEAALRCIGVSKGDEIIVPDYTYPATAAVAPIVGATSVIVDVDKDSMLIDYDAIESAINPKTKALIPVSGFGNPLDYNRLLEIKNKYGLFIIEDAACSIGAEFEGKKVGQWADISVFSLHPRKFITTGEGGMITTNNAKWGEWINSYKHFGMNLKEIEREGIQFDIIGTNYKLSNILAAIGLSQMNKINELLAKRIQLAQNYVKLLRGIKEVSIPDIHQEGKHAYQSFCIFIENRNKIMKEMREQEIEVQIGTYALHMHKAFNNNTMVRIHGDMNNSKWVFDHCLALPLYHDLTNNEQEHIIDVLLKHILK